MNVVLTIDEIAVLVAARDICAAKGATVAANAITALLSFGALRGD